MGDFRKKIILQADFEGKNILDLINFVWNTLTPMTS